MVQVDVFWGYGLGASLAVASGVQLTEKPEPFYSKYFVYTILFLSLFWAPTGMLLLLRHPSWETMQAAGSLGDISPWLVLSFGITNVTQGILGFWIGQKLMSKGKYLWANINWVLGYYGMFFILLYGWDGLGYDRFLCDRDMLPGSPAWSAGASGAQVHAWASVIHHLASSVAMTLYMDGIYLLPPYFYLMAKWVREGASLQNIKQPSGLRVTLTVLAVVFMGGLGCAAISALTVNYTGALLGVGNHVARAQGTIPANTTMHILSYLIGLPLSLLLMWFLLWRPGKPLSRLLGCLMPGTISNLTNSTPPPSPQAISAV
jgi:hypothetical protein